ncbi:MAG TPA: multicopper oxidase domain-containing protein [Longimicrobiaceae bacterium]|nr:multicopper oxidase domain-containing protein [Longimicrobiaceae bacterium]
MATEPDAVPPRLSEIIDAPRSRRVFLSRAAAAGAALAAASCGKGGVQQRSQNADSVLAPGGRPATIGTGTNSDSRLDSALGTGHATTSHTPAVAAATTIPFHRYSPRLPPLSDDRTLRLHWTAREAPIRIDPDVTVAAWTFEGDVPGPIVHVRQGDTVEFTLTNEGSMPHSMDFHAAQVNPKKAFRSVLKGQSVTYSFRPKHAGAYLYHCGTGPVLLHIGSGMYGAIIVDPPEPLPPAKEFVLVQSEWYLSPGPNGISICDYNKMMGELPDYVCFNGRPDQYIHEPIHVERGDRVRFHIVNAGPTHPCYFHVVGEQFDTVYLGAPPDNAIRGVQTFAVAAGGGMVFEFTADIEGEFPFVNHGFGHGQKGAMGTLVVE